VNGEEKFPALIKAMKDVSGRIYSGNNTINTSNKRKAKKPRRNLSTLNRY
jgi:hypothetical protein